MDELICWTVFGAGLILGVLLNSLFINLQARIWRRVAEHRRDELRGQEQFIDLIQDAVDSGDGWKVPLLLERRRLTSTSGE